MDLRVPNATKSDSGIGSLCMLCHAGVASDPGANTRPIPPVDEASQSIHSGRTGAIPSSCPPEGLGCTPLHGLVHLSIVLVGHSNQCEKV